MPKSPRSTRRKRKFISQAPENDPMAPSLTLGDNNGEEVATNEAGDETPAFKRTETFKPTAMDMARHETGQGGTEAQDQPSPSKVGSPPDERIGKKTRSKEDFPRPAEDLSVVQQQQTPRPSGKEEPWSEEPSWEDKYKALKTEVCQLLESQEEDVKLARAKQLEAEAKQKEAELRLSKYERSIVDYKTAQYFRAFGPDPTSGNIGSNYLHLHYALHSISRELTKVVDLSTFEKLFTSPRYWEIANPGIEPWMWKLLEEGNPYWQRGNIIYRVLLTYVLRSVCKPMLVGLDREAETLLKRLEDNMQSRMLPSDVDRWISETLHSYSLLPRYAKDRENFLQPHTDSLKQFITSLLPKKPNESCFDLTSLKGKIEKLDESIMVRAADIASEMSFTCPEFLVDWDYCDRKTEIFRGDLHDHDLFCFKTGYQLCRENFEKLDSDEKKIADAVMLVRPPIFMINRAGPRKMLGRPLISVLAVPECEEWPIEKKSVQEFLHEMSDSETSVESQEEFERGCEAQLAEESLPK